MDPEVTAGGIVIPDIAKDRTVKGIVKYRGPKVSDEIQIGDFVMFSAYSGTTVQFGKDSDGTLLIMREEFITAKFGPIDTEVPGLYFRGKNEGPQMYQELKNIVEQYDMPDPNAMGRDQLIQGIVSIIAKYNPFFLATYEMMMNIAADTLRDHPIMKQMKLLEPSDKLTSKKLNARPDVTFEELVPEDEL